jgi:hypothetical protein
MKDAITVLLIVVLVIGLWLAIHIFAIIAGTGLAVIVLYTWVKEFNEGKSYD